jgi:hypothetical protein
MRCHCGGSVHEDGCGHERAGNGGICGDVQSRGTWSGDGASGPGAGDPGLLRQ